MGHPVGEGLHSWERDLVLVQPWVLSCTEVAVGRHSGLLHATPPGPLARNFKPHLPSALPASCQGTFLCVFPLDASLVREMFFCEGRGTSWDLPCANPQPQRRWPCKPG